MVIVDECESLLHHCTAKTLAKKQAIVFKTLCSMLKCSKHVLDKETRKVCEALGLPLTVIRNTHKPRQVRRFIFMNKQVFWVDQIIEKLNAGKNVAIASMGAEQMKKLKAFLVANGVLRKHEILVIDSKADDALKNRLQHVNEDWVKYR